MSLLHIRLQCDQSHLQLFGFSMLFRGLFVPRGEEGKNQKTQRENFYETQAWHIFSEILSENLNEYPQEVF